MLPDEKKEALAPVAELPGEKAESGVPNVDAKDGNYAYSDVLAAGYTPGAEQTGAQAVEPVNNAKPNTYVYRPEVKADLAPGYPRTYGPQGGAESGVASGMAEAGTGDGITPGATGAEEGSAGLAKARSDAYELRGNVKKDTETDTLDYVQQAQSGKKKQNLKINLPPQVKFMLVKLKKSLKKNKRTLLMIGGSIAGMVLVIALVIGIVNLIANLNKPAEVVIEEEPEEERVVVLTQADENTPLEPGEVTVTVGGEEVIYHAAYLVDGIDATIGSGEFKSTTNDENVFLVINGGSLTVTGSVKITKNSKDREDRSATAPLGTNAAVAVIGEGSFVNLSGTTITTEDDGADGVVALNMGTAAVNSGMITTTAINSRGIVAVAGGTAEANSVIIKTSAKSSPALATGIATNEDKPTYVEALISQPHGTMIATKVSLTTARLGSPLLYVGGDMTVMESRGTASGAQIAILEGKNSLTLSGDNFTAAGAGVKQNVDNAGLVFFANVIDPAEREAEVNIDYCNLTLSSNASLYNSTPMMFATNTSVSGTVTNSSLSFSQQSVLIKATGSAGWGEHEKNGARVVLTLDNNTLTNMEVNADSLSEVGV